MVGSAVGRGKKPEDVKCQIFCRSSRSHVVVEEGEGKRNEEFNLFVARKKCMQ